MSVFPFTLWQPSFITFQASQHKTQGARHSRHDKNRPDKNERQTEWNGSDTLTSQDKTETKTNPNPNPESNPKPSPNIPNPSPDYLQRYVR